MCVAQDTVLNASVSYPRAEEGGQRRDKYLYVHVFFIFIFIFIFVFRRQGVGCGAEGDASAVRVGSA